MTMRMMIPVSLGGLLGCAGAPAQLVDARDAYLTARNGPSAVLAPVELHAASRALDQANQVFDRDGDTLELRDYAYIAERRVEIAGVVSRSETDRRSIVAAVQQGVVLRDDEAVALGSAGEQLPGEGGGAASPLDRNRARAPYDELHGRSMAEAPLDQAMRDIAAFATVKREARGVVITLNMSILFGPGKSTLLETAKAKLDRVARALGSRHEDRTMIVEGHTDNQGSDATRLTLSLGRARSVRDALVIGGLDGEVISAAGVGSSRPLVDNGSARNRARNRRVEIIIQPPPLSGAEAAKGRSP
jgi:outer membrane protein OmpA-like peptidoglycan-associated protein